MQDSAQKPGLAFLQDTAGSAMVSATNRVQEKHSHAKRLLPCLPLGKAREGEAFACGAQASACFGAARLSLEVRKPVQLTDLACSVEAR
jgi:hypothetical protein